MYDLQQLNSLPIEDVARRLGLDLCRHSCRCFMHDDHRPSLFFSVAKNRWRCFVCDVGGSPIDLVMHHRHSSFRDACHWLADAYGIVHRPSSSSRVWQKPTSPATPKPLVQTPHTVQAIPIDPKSITCSPTVASCFVRSGLLTEGQMQHASIRYRLDSYEDGIVYWQIDAEGRIREGKVMYYMADGHRSHERKPITMSWLMKHRMTDADGHPLLGKDWTTSHCLFGLHLLNENPTTVAVVEGEKTAVVCSELLPDVVWMASGGLSALTPDLLMPLQGRKLILFPDTDTDGTTFRRWTAIAEEASAAMNQHIMVSNLLEQGATEQQKQKKIDILDYLFENR